MHIPKWLIATAALVLAVLIVTVAFLIGRESSRPSPAGTAASAASPAVSAPSESSPEAPAASPSTAITAPASAPSFPSLPTLNEPASSRPATPSSPIASNPVPAGPPVSADARARVAAYFSQMESIQSGGMIGNEEEFAKTILTAALGGNFAGIDDLVTAAGDAERRAVALQPPSECAEYHQMVITMLQESKAMVTTLRDGLKRNDADVLTAIGVSAQGMKSRADNLASVERALRARYGLSEK